MQRPCLAIAAIALFALTGAGCASHSGNAPAGGTHPAASAPPGGAYQKVSDLSPAGSSRPGTLTQPGDVAGRRSATTATFGSSARST
jgi:hypothetical protein